MLRDEWKFEYRSDELAEAAQQKLRFHEERLAFWRQKKQEVMTTIRAEGRDSNYVPSRSALLGAFGLEYDNAQRSRQPDHSPVSVRNSMKYSSCPIGAALSASQRTCRRPPALCTPEHDKGVFSLRERFNID